MRNFFFLIMLLISCSPRNPYYGVPVFGAPYEDFFKARLNEMSVKVTGENSIDANTFQYTFPANLGGSNIIGNCVIEVLLNNAQQVRKVNLIGIMLQDKQATRIFGFDRYHPLLKRVPKQHDKEFDKYMNFIETLPQKFIFQKLSTESNRTDTAYCKIIFK